MKNHMEVNQQPHLLHRVTLSWSAIICGAFVALGLGFLLQLFSLAIGLSAYHTSASGQTIAIGGVLGLLVGAIASMGVAGLVSGYLGRFCRYHASEAFIYGFSTWSLALLLGAILMLPLSHHLSYYKENILGQGKPIAQKVMTASDTPVKSQEPVKDQSDVKATENTLTRGSWVAFLLFFIGAISSCIGAYCGMECKRKHRHLESEAYL